MSLEFSANTASRLHKRDELYKKPYCANLRKCTSFIKIYRLDRENIYNWFFCYFPKAEIKHVSLFSQ